MKNVTFSFLIVGLLFGLALPMQAAVGRTAPKSWLRKTKHKRKQLAAFVTKERLCTVAQLLASGALFLKAGHTLYHGIRVYNTAMSNNDDTKTKYQKETVGIIAKDFSCDIYTGFEKKTGTFNTVQIDQNFLKTEVESELIKAEKNMSAYRHAQIVDTGLFLLAAVAVFGNKIYHYAKQLIADQGWTLPTFTTAMDSRAIKQVARDELELFAIYEEDEEEE